MGLPSEHHTVSSLDPNRSAEVRCFEDEDNEALSNPILTLAVPRYARRRIDANRHFLCPCIEVDESHKARERSSSMSAHVERQKSVKSVNTLSSMGGLSRASSSFSRSAYISIRGYKEKPSAVEHFMYSHYGSFLQYETVQMWVLILFSLSALLLGVMSYFAGVGLTI